jgi:beta-1,4-mannosyltransferase
MTPRLRAVLWPAELNRADQPYNWLLSRSLRDAGVEVEEFSPRRSLSRPDIWHLHWPDAILNDAAGLRVVKNLAGLAALLWAARRRGTAIIWTIHNLSSHERLYPRLERWFWDGFTGSVDGYISLSHSAKAAALERFPSLASRPGAVIPIGHYRGVYPDDVSGPTARTRLGVPAGARVIAFVGQVRPYKGVVELVARFRGLADDDARLIIAGRPNSQELRRSILVASAGDPRIILNLEFVPPDELQTYLRAADLVVLPFIEILNSASALLALSFDRPILVPSRGSMAELQQVVGRDWVRVFDGDLQTEDLRAALDWAAQPRTSPPLAEFSWSTIGRLTAEAYVATRAHVDGGRR